MKKMYLSNLISVESMKEVKILLLFLEVSSTSVLNALKKSRNKIWNKNEVFEISMKYL